MAANVAALLTIKEKGEAKGREGMEGRQEESVEKSQQRVGESLAATLTEKKDTHQDEREKNERNIEKEVKKRTR